MDKKISNFNQIASIKRYTLAEGKESGLKVVEVDNGVLRFTLNESKALDIMQLWCKGENLSFVSKNGFSVRETPFVNRFEGGMIYTVGLDSAGGREGFIVHGSFHNIPAKVISCICNENIIEVVAEIEDTELFGKNLKMIRKITTKPMSNTLYLEDTLVNCGTKAENYCLLYHCNFGYPLLDENLEIKFSEKSVFSRTAISKENEKELHKFWQPVDNQEECCYFIENEKPEVVLANKKQNKTVRFTYSGDTLPKMVLWKSNASTDYALGIEPTTTFLDDKFEYSVIKEGEEKKFNINFCIE